MFLWEKVDQLNVVDKLLGVFGVVKGLAHQGSNDAGQLLGSTIGDCFPTGYIGPKGGAYFVDFRKSIKQRELHWLDIVFCAEHN